MDPGPRRMTIFAVCLTVLLGGPLLAWSLSNTSGPPYGYERVMGLIVVASVIAAALVSGAAAVSSPYLSWGERILGFLGWQFMMSLLLLTELLVLGFCEILRSGLSGFDGIQ